MYLNVYRPLLSAAPPLPVMVWIFGGGWTAGSGTWDEYGPQVVMMMMMMMMKMKMIADNGEEEEDYFHDDDHRVV